MSANGDGPATPSRLTLVGKMAAATINPASSPGDSSQRRSSRVRKAPEVFDPTPVSISKRKRTKNADEDDASGSDEAENSEDDEQEEGDEDDEEEEGVSDVEHAKSTQSKKRKEKTAPGVKKTKAPPAKKARTNMNAAVSKLNGTPKPRRKAKTKANGDGEEMSLYEQLLGADPNETEDIARTWTKSYEDNQSEAMLKLVNCIIESCGCSGRVTIYDIEDPDSAADKLQDILDEFQKEQAADYPIVSRQSKFRGFKASLLSFFDSLVEHWHAASLFYTDSALIESVQVWTSAMSSSGLRPFRHTSTAISLALVTALCTHVKETTGIVSGLTKSLEAEKKPKKSNTGRPNAGRIKDYEARIEEAQNKVSVLEGVISEIIDSVFVHRYRDVDPRVRTDCIHELGVWLIKLPNTFFEASYLRYLGWVLSDMSPLTRLEVLNVLTLLFEDRGNVAGLRHFTDKFRLRLVEIALQDADSAVRARAVELLNEVRQVGFLESEDVDQIGRLMYDSDLKVRNAAAAFFNSNIADLYNDELENFGSLDVVMNALEESGDVENEDYEAHKIAWIKIKCLVISLTSYDVDDEEDSSSQADANRTTSGGQESRFTLAGLALCKVVPEIQKWVELTKYLLYDHTGVQAARDDVISRIKAFCALSAKEEAILLQLLYSSVASAVAMAEHNPAKSKSRKSGQDSQETISRHLAQWIPRLLNKFGPVPDGASNVLRLIPLMKLDVYQDLRQMPAYSSLLDDINQQFVTHADDSVLREASAALLHARSFDELEEVTTEKIVKLQEDVISGLVDAARGKDMEIVALNDTSLSEIETAVKRLEYLSGISDCKDALEHPAVSTAPAKKAKGKGKRGRKSQGTNGTQEDDIEDQTPTLPIDILTSILVRGASVDESEDELILRTVKALGLYMMWNVQQLSVSQNAPAEDDGHRQEEFENFKKRHTALVNVLLRIADERRTVDEVKMDAATLLVDMATFSSMVSVAAEARDVIFSRTMPQSMQNKVLKIYTSAEKQFAKIADKRLEAPEDDDVEDVDEEDEDEELEYGEEDQLVFENHLCSFAGKLVLAILWEVIDEAVFKPRLERNKKHLGANMKEIIHHLQFSSEEAKAKLKPTLKAKFKSAEMIDSGEDDEIEDEEAARAEELEQEAEQALHDDEIAEQRQVTPAVDEDEEMGDADD